MWLMRLKKRWRRLVSSCTIAFVPSITKYQAPRLLGPLKAIPSSRAQSPSVSTGPGAATTQAQPLCSSCPRRKCSLGGSLLEAVGFEQGLAKWGGSRWERDYQAREAEAGMCPPALHPHWAGLPHRSAVHRSPTLSQTAAEEAGLSQVWSQRGGQRVQRMLTGLRVVK